jgi:hypothetical protein
MTPSTSARSEAGGKAKGRWRSLPLSRLLMLSAAYWVLAVGYNVTRLLWAQEVGGALPPTDPFVRMAVMAAYGGGLIAGLLRYIVVYRAVMAAAVGLGWGSLLAHILNAASGRLSFYGSVLSWAVVVAVTLFGFILNILAATGRFEDRRIR